MTAPSISCPEVCELDVHPRGAVARCLPSSTQTQDPPAGAPAAPVRVCNVLLVEHQALFRYFLKEFINRIPGFHVVGDFASSAVAAEACGGLKTDLAIVDFLAWETSLPDLVGSLRSENARATVLVLSANVEPYCIEQAFAAGVTGIVDKNIGLDLLERAIRAVAGGRQFFSPDATLAWREVLKRKSDVLSDRERDVLREIAQGRFSKEVASCLGVSVFTVENIRRRIMKKTGLRSVAELALHAVRLGLVPPPRGAPAARETRPAMARK